MTVRANRITRLPLREGFDVVSRFVDQLVFQLLALEPAILDLAIYEHDEWIDLLRLATTEADA